MKSASPAHLSSWHGGGGIDNSNMLVHLFKMPVKAWSWNKFRLSVAAIK